jgi:hypothetical protein
MGRPDGRPMTFAKPIFPTLAEATARRLSRLPLPLGWHHDEALARFTGAAEVLAAASAPQPVASRRLVQRALLRLAATDSLAAEALLGALTPALRAVSAALSRRTPVGSAEVDALVAGGAWEAICSFAGTNQAWPDRAVVHRARDLARSALRPEATRRRREVYGGELSELADDRCAHVLATVVACDLLARAVERGQLSRGTARLLWQARVDGRSTAELAATMGRSPEAVSMERLRAERSLRQAVA